MAPDPRERIIDEALGDATYIAGGEEVLEALEAAGYRVVKQRKAGSVGVGLLTEGWVHDYDPEICVSHGCLPVWVDEEES